MDWRQKLMSLMGNGGIGMGGNDMGMGGGMGGIGGGGMDMSSGMGMGGGDMGIGGGMGMGGGMEPTGEQLQAMALKQAEMAVDRPILLKPEKMSFLHALEEEIAQLKFVIEDMPDAPEISLWRSELKRYEALLGRIQKIPIQGSWRD